VNGAGHPAPSAAPAGRLMKRRVDPFGCHPLTSLDAARSTDLHCL
jgi:hypothetical protein